MSDLPIGPELVGAKVQNAARPDWGVGTVVRIERTQAGGAPAHRVWVQFQLGRKAMLVPPARLIAPQPPPTRTQGWLDTLAANTLDDRLRRLPDEAVNVLGTPRDKLDALLPLYGWTEDSNSILRWARKQTGVGDPLSEWTRDELLAAFAAFVQERDAALRAAVARLRMTAGPEAVSQWRAALPEELRAAVEAALAKVL